MHIHQTFLKLPGVTSFGVKLRIFFIVPLMKSIRILKGKRVVECQLDDDNYPTFKVRILEKDGEKMDVIKKDDQPISSEEWTE